MVSEGWEKQSIYVNPTMRSTSTVGEKRNDSVGTADRIRSCRLSPPGQPGFPLLTWNDINPSASNIRQDPLVARKALRISTLARNALGHTKGPPALDGGAGPGKTPVRTDG